MDQSKLYIKEYQSLRFNNEVIEEKDVPKLRKDVEKIKFLNKSSSKVSKKNNFTERTFDYEKNSTQELLESKELIGFGETYLPELNFDSSNFSKFSPNASFSHFPFINKSYSPHFKLQGILLKKNEINSFNEPFIKSYPCKCSKRPQILIIGNLNTW